jgi:hypothetical protein
MSIVYSQNVLIKAQHPWPCSRVSFTCRLRVTNAQKVGEGPCGTIRRADRIRLYRCRHANAAHTRRGLPAYGRSR